MPWSHARSIGLVLAWGMPVCRVTQCQEGVGCLLNNSWREASFTSREERSHSLFCPTLDRKIHIPVVISFINVSSGGGEKKKASTFRKEDNGSEWAHESQNRRFSTGGRDQPPCPTPLHLDCPPGECGEGRGQWWRGARGIPTRETGRKIKEMVALE